MNTTNSKFEFKPLPKQQQSETIESRGASSMFKNQSMREKRRDSLQNTSAVNENVNSWLHGTYKGKDGTYGKVAKAFRHQPQVNIRKMDHSMALFINSVS